MDVVLYIIGIALSGLVIGALARLLLPGRDPMTLLQTILVGITGSLIAGLIAYFAFDRDEGPGFLLSLLCAFLLVFAIRKLRERGDRAATEAPGDPAVGTRTQTRV